MYLCLLSALYVGFRELNFLRRCPLLSKGQTKHIHQHLPALCYVDTRTTGVKIRVFFGSSLCRRHFLQELIIAHPVQEFPGRCRLAELHKKPPVARCLETPLVIYPTVSVRKMLVSVRHLHRYSGYNSYIFPKDIHRSFA